MLDIKDFIFTHKKNNGGYEDYWFKVEGKSKEELTRRYMEMCMIEISAVVYSPTDGAVGVQRLFQFNNDVVELRDGDEDLKEILKKLVESVKE